MGSRRRAAAIASPSLVCAFSLTSRSSSFACQVALSATSGSAAAPSWSPAGPAFFGSLFIAASTGLSSFASRRRTTTPVLDTFRATPTSQLREIQDLFARPGKLVWDDAAVNEGLYADDADGRLGAGFQSMAAGDWTGARDAFAAVLDVAEVPEAFFGLANALFWLGDLAGTIANCEKAYAGFRRRGDPMFAAGAALALVGYNKGYLGNTAAARGWLSRAARIIENEAPELRGELLGVLGGVEGRAEAAVAVASVRLQQGEPSAASA